MAALQFVDSFVDRSSRCRPGVDPRDQQPGGAHGCGAVPMDSAKKGAAPRAPRAALYRADLRQAQRRQARRRAAGALLRPAARCKRLCMKPTPDHECKVWVPRTVSRLLISGFASGALGSRCAGRRRMIARRGPPTRLSAARPRTELVGAARPIRRSQGRRDPGAPPRGSRAVSDGDVHQLVRPSPATPPHGPAGSTSPTARAARSTPTQGRHVRSRSHPASR
jgi:hypothetical protein